MSVDFTYQIPEAEIQAVILRKEKSIEDNLNTAVDKTLDLVENSQIKASTAGGNPTRPSGSTYVRTFTLQQASEKERTGTRLPDISGVWRANEGKARYAPYVIGSRAEQADVHRGRWKALEDVIAEVEEKAPGIIREQLNG